MAVTTRQGSVAVDGGTLSIDALTRPRSRFRSLLVVGGLGACLAAAAVTSLGQLKAGVHPQTQRHSVQHQASKALPSGLAPLVSANIGASEQSFWPLRHGDFLRADGGGIQSSFSGSGAELRVANGTLGLSLAEVGRAGHLAPLAAVAPVAAGNEVVYRDGGLTAFYRNGPYGLEQGFTVEHRPAAGTGPLVLSLSLSGSLKAVRDGSEIFFRSAAGQTALRYGQLHAVDATGRELSARVRLGNGKLQLAIDDAHARYPIRIDPFVQQGEALTGSEAIGEGDFGESVALSGDGDTAFVGAPRDDGGQGAVWVFTRSGSTWTQQGGKLTEQFKSGESPAGFGSSVALSADGNTALISGDLVHACRRCRETVEEFAWVYTRSGSTWTPQATPLISSAGLKSYEEFSEIGRCLALSADGTTALVGGSIGGRFPVAWVFTRSGSTWPGEGQELTMPGPGEGSSYQSAALSAGGNVALIGAATGDKNGAAWVFTRSGSTWIPRGEELTGSGEVGESQFGSSVTLSGVGSTAVIGGPGDDGGRGAAWVFGHSVSGWKPQGEKLTGSGHEGSFGSSVALSEDGNTALIGSGAHDGAAWLFKRTGSVWTQQGEPLSDGAGDFGSSVALSSNGETAMIGGGPHNLRGQETAVGGAWGFEFVTSPAQAPTAVSDVASDITPSSATLSATVNPNSGTVTDCRFQYGRLRGRREQVPCAPSPGSGEGPVAVSAPVTDLQPNTSYRFRITARNAEGRSIGSYVAFTTSAAQAPSVASDAASSITATTSTLNATVNPNGERVRGCRFEYGPTTEYGSVAPCSPSPGSGGEPVAVSAHLRGLSEYTTYHFRVLARNRIGSGEGPDLTFTTSSRGSLIQEGSKISADIGFAGEELFTEGGGSFADTDRIGLSADGDTMVVGAPSDSWGGSARVYVRMGSTWTLQARLVFGLDERNYRPEPGAAAFGSSVAISGDGNTIIVGSPHDDYYNGSTAIFNRSAGIWTREATPGGIWFGPKGRCEETCLWGQYVALSGNGDESASVSYSAIDSRNGNAGGVVLSSTASLPHAPSFEGLPIITEVKSVALSADGNTLLIGGLEGKLGSRGGLEAEKSGIVLAFTRSGETWQEQTLTGTGEDGGGEFGSSMALSANGETALIGGSADNGGAGAAWVFTHSASGWTQQGQKLTAGNEIGTGEFGSAVALSADGSKALIGGPGDNANVGAAWEFDRFGESWIQRPSKLTASDETGEGRFASSLALSAEGSEAVIGAPGDSGGVGALWSFGRELETPRRRR